MFCFQDTTVFLFEAVEAVLGPSNRIGMRRLRHGVSWNTRLRIAPSIYISERDSRVFYGCSRGVAGIYLLSLTFFCFSFPRGQADDQPVDLLNGGGRSRAADTSCGTLNNNTDESPTPQTKLFPVVNQP